MQDEEIIQLYFERKEAAIAETETAYGKYLLKIAYNILADIEDCKECVNDTYLKAWNTIPPNKPAVLSAYLGKIARENAIDIYRKKNRNKRKMSEYALALDELTECVSDKENAESTVDAKLLGKEISRFLNTVSDENQAVFVMRYYHCDSLKNISQQLNMSEAKIKSMLHRTRKGLKKHLIKEGFDL